MSLPEWWGSDKQYRIEDCLEGVKSIPDKVFDLVIADPPYFLPAAHYQTRTQFRRNFSDLGILEHFIRDLMTELGRVLKSTGTIYMFCDGQSYPLFYYHLYPMLKTVRPIIWDKKTSINGFSWRHQHEIIIFGEMPDAEKVPSGDGDIVRYDAVPIEKRIHPAEKPIELVMKLVEKSSKRGGLVLDPFLGSGTTISACRRVGRTCLGFELEKSYETVIEKRCSEDIPDIETFASDTTGRFF